MTEHTVQAPVSLIEHIRRDYSVMNIGPNVVDALDALLSQSTPTIDAAPADLPVGSVVRDGDGTVWERAYVGHPVDNDSGWFMVEFSVAVHDDALTPPVAVLFTPQPVPPHRYVGGRWDWNGMCNAIVDQDGGPGRCSHPRAHAAHIAGEARS